MIDNNAMITDEQARKKIVSEIGKSFFVEAGAGSGKTTMLVNRMVSMVESGIDIREISAITFTKAAAAEFYKRFQAALIKRSRQPESESGDPDPGALPATTAESRERCAEALINIDLCFMGTIDAFCQKILSEHPAEAGMPSETILLSDNERKTAYKQMYLDICSGAHGAELKSISDEFNRFFDDPETVFACGFNQIMDLRNLVIDCEEPDYPIDLNRIFAAERSELIRIVECLIKLPENYKYVRNKDSRKAWDSIQSIYTSICDEWNDIDLILKIRDDLKPIGIKPEAIDRFLDPLGPFFEPYGKTASYYTCNINKGCGIIDKIDNLKHDLAISFMLKCLSAVETELKRKGQLSFFDCQYYLRDMLKKDAAGEGKLIKYIASRHKYFLIDEFQDTNPIQAEIFFYLSAVEINPDWRKCTPRAGSLFIVGDPKQSIYRFRGADVTSFLNVKRVFEEKGGETLLLTSNFRSTRTLCDYFNRVFETLLPDETAEQSRFERIPLPDRADNEFTGVYKYDSSSNQNKPGDARYLAKLIKSLVNNDKYLIWDEKQKVTRPARFNDIMIISYDKEKIDMIAPGLNCCGIKTKVEGSNPFSDNPALYDLTNIFSSVADTGNTIALYAALTGMIIGLTNDELSHYVSHDNRLSLKYTDDIKGDEIGSVARVAEQLKKMRELSKSAARLSPSALLDLLIEEYRPYLSCPIKQLEPVYFAMELLRNEEQTGSVISLKDAAVYLRGLINDDTDEERCLSFGGSSDCVHIANLHKVKGLEAPVVILCETKPPKIYPPQFRTDYTSTDPRGYIFEIPHPVIKYPYCHTTKYEREKDDEARALSQEDIRLLYVAATRARNVLIVWDHETTANEQKSSSSKWSRLIENDTPDISTVLTTDDSPAGAAESSSLTATELYDRAERESVLKTGRIRETASFKTANPSRQRVLSKYSEEQKAEIDSPDGADEFSDDVAEAKSTPGSLVPPALTGTAVHRLMELLVVSGARINVQEAIGGILDEFLTNETEVHREALRATLRDVADVIARGGYEQSNGAPKDILTTLLGAEEVYCELPFCYKEETGADTVIWNGIMDVVYLANGRWHIVDYKTNADGSDLDRKYSAQLTAYEKAFESITGFKADALIYHIDK